MKIIVVSILAAALVLTVGTVSAFAAGSRFVNSNSDGVCDNWTPRARRPWAERSGPWELTA